MGEATIWVPNIYVLQDRYGKRFDFLDMPAVELGLNGPGTVEADVFDKQTGVRCVMTVRRSD